MSGLTNALIITALGMGLVFSMIILLWGLMSFLVAVTTKQEVKEKVEQNIGFESDIDRKQQAAVVAVTVALLRERTAKPHEFPLPPTALVSAWQAVMRSEMLKKRGQKR